MDLTKVKLKKTVLKEPKMDLKHELELEKKQNERLRAVDLESWYSRIEEFTYPTKFLELSPQEAQALIDEYWLAKKSPETANWHQNQVLEQLRERLDDALQKSGFSEGVFVKLSSRSPKDSRRCQAAAKKLALQRLTQMRQERALTTNDLVIAIMTTGIETLRAVTAADVIEIFLTSDRCCEDDLPLALNFPQRWSQHLVIRKWVPIPIQYEFRGFVIDNKLTGLTQYFNNAFFPDLVQNKEKILHMIRKLFDDVKGPLAKDLDPPEYVLDIAVDLEHNKAYVIELNPFGRTGVASGTSLFDMTRQHDRDVLMGDAPFEFRIETAPTAKPPEAWIRGEWKIFYQQNGFIK